MSIPVLVVVVGGVFADRGCGCGSGDAVAYC